MSKIKVTVNHDRCVGSKLCIYFSPAVFHLNENGQSVATHAGAAAVQQVIETAEQCPQSAIRVEDEETREVLFPPADLGI